MEEPVYQQWWKLHLRVARGESLSSEDREAYDAGLRSLEQDEQFRNATDARRAREEWVALNLEHSNLEKRRQALDSVIAEFESRLSRQTRQYLGVED